MCKVNSSLHVQCGSGSDGGGPTNWVPNTDVYTTENGLVVKVELAGLRPESLDLVVERNLLIIRGDRADSSRQPGIKFLVMEIHYGPFACVLNVPAGYDLVQARAIYQNGFLRIDVPLAAKPPSSAVSVSVSEFR